MVEVYSTQLQYLNDGDTFDLELNCYETKTMKTKGGSEEEGHQPILLWLRMEGSSNDQAGRRADCLTFQAPLSEGSVSMEEKVQTTFYIRQMACRMDNFIAGTISKDAFVPPSRDRQRG